MNPRYEKHTYPVQEEVLALQQLSEEATDPYEYKILTEWFSEIKSRAEQENSEIPVMTLGQNTIEIGSALFIFPPDKSQAGHQSQPEPNKHTREEADIRHWLEFQRAGFLGKIATKWREEGTKLTFHRGIRQFDSGPEYDILTRKKDGLKQAIAECTQPGNAAFLVNDTAENWQTTLTTTKRDFTKSADGTTKQRLIHTGTQQDWVQKANQFFNQTEREL